MFVAFRAAERFGTRDPASGAHGTSVAGRVREMRSSRPSAGTGREAWSSADAPLGSPRCRAAEDVGVLASRRETRDTLARYLSESGFRADCLTRLSDDDLRPSARAVVVFPDDFEIAAVRRFLDGLRRRRPDVLIVVVTRAPAVLEPAVRARDGATTPVLLPRPPFGWSIVDVLRSHVGTGRR